MPSLMAAIEYLPNKNKKIMEKERKITALTKQVMEIVEDTGVEKWGAEPGEVYYVIRLKGGNQ
jgi:hypothetical protein